MKTAPDPLLQIAAAPAMAAKLGHVLAGQAELFPHVVTAAQPLVVALLAGAAKARVWVACPDVRTQEAMHNDLAQWFQDAILLPELERAPVVTALPDPEIAAERLGIVQRLTTAKGRQIVVLTRASLDSEVPSPAAIRQLTLPLHRGMQLDQKDLLRKLTEAGYEQAAQVSARGQFAVRGGILDVFSFHHALPLRIELQGHEVESLREFSLETQLSVGHLHLTSLMLGESASEQRSCPLHELIETEDLTIDVEASWFSAQVRITEGSAGFGAGDLEMRKPEEEEEERKKSKLTRSRKKAAENAPEAAAPGGQVVPDEYSTAFYEHGLGEFHAGDFVVDEIRREQFFAQLREWRTQEWRVHVFCNNEGEIERLRDLLPPVESDPLNFLIGTLNRGFTFPAAKVAVLSDAELFGRYRHNRARRLALRGVRDQVNRTQIDFTELSQGDYVVHLEHGIARYEGLRAVPRDDGASEEMLVLVFANDARLYVPLEQSHLVSRYVGVGKKHPALSSLGDGKWAKAKRSAENAVADYARRLLTLHAEREMAKGFAFPPDNKWQHEFEASFLYRETPDQLSAIAATKADMESERPMDRLICGDVGFGKTEVAIRAAFKAVMGGKQVAVLVPTTVLAQQHYQNLRERMSDYPITVDTLSRFRTPAEQRKTMEGLRDGSVNIVVGTHRLISKDISFKDLGLVVIDEEQRFGVLHKERFKEMFQLVDMLTLSATPIPRTLYLSLMGAKDMSTLETPPLNRIPTETLICPYDERIIRDAINRELARQGQVYFLHNRVETIQQVQRRIRQLCPKARIVVGHGQMDEHELEDVMQEFVSGAADVLISTTIIESGLDIPNANTIIIDRADRFGLAHLYQLRGRVGRAQHKAYAYLLLPPGSTTSGEARKRINAIKQYSSLGAGFKIAMRDLEIRGAGNILGTAQSGHIITIGFDLYCSLLKQAVAKLKGGKVKARLEVVLRLDFVVTREVEFAPQPALTVLPSPKPFVATSGANGNHHGWTPKVLPDPTPAESEGVTPRVSTKAPAFLPASYIGEAQPRIQAYRRLADVNSQKQLDALRETWRDRFGPLPDAAENLLVISRIKLIAATRKITQVEVSGDKLMVTRGGDYVQTHGKFPRLSASTPGERLREIVAMLRRL